MDVNEIFKTIDLLESILEASTDEELHDLVINNVETIEELIIILQNIYKV